MHPVAPDVVVRQLQWRYATKKFDAAKKIPAADWEALEQALVLAPSSFGLQPWKFVVVVDPAVRARLLPASWNQQQVVQASHMVVFAIKKDLGAADVETYVQRIASVRGVPAASLDAYKEMMTKFVARPREKFDVNAWASHQVYIAIGQFMACAALMAIDTCPMEGIVPAQYDEILGLAAKGLATSVVCCAGYRAADDKYAAAKKVRFERDDVVVHV
jgi:nitroreductase